MSIDFVRAWEITRSVEREYHHNKCSYNQALLLCDCDVIYKHKEYLDSENFYGKGGEVIKKDAKNV